MENLERNPEEKEREGTKTKERNVDGVGFKDDLEERKTTGGVYEGLMEIFEKQCILLIFNFF